MITLACHFARADLCMFADYHSFLKRRLAAVRGTMVTTTRFLTLDLPFPDGKRRVTVSVIDTTLLAPPSSPLADLGAHIGLPKLEIMPGYSIAEMARYRDEQPEAFNAYALQDAEIAARYASQISNLFQELGIPGRAPTLGLCRGCVVQAPLAEEGLARVPGSGHGIEQRKAPPLETCLLRRGAHAVHRRMLSRRHEHDFPRRLFAEWTSGVGYRSCRGLHDRARRGRLSELGNRPPLEDPSSTSLLSTRRSLSLRSNLDFLQTPNFHVCPSVSADKHGLIYPLEGESWCCGPELVVALAMGATIQVMEGYRVDRILRSR